MSAAGPAGPTRADRRIDLSVYLVVDPPMCAARGAAGTVRAAVAGGVTAVQLRDPDADARTLCRTSELLLDVLAGTGVPLIVNDRLDVALAVGADGAHLGQDDLPVESARRIAGPDLLIGWSVSHPDHLSALRRMPPATVDYLGLGPYRATPTKPDAATPQGASGLTALAAEATALGLPTVAIGGITTDDVPAVRDTGVDGVAVVSAVCAAVDPEAAARRLRTATDRWAAS